MALPDQLIQTMYDEWFAQWVENLLICNEARIEPAICNQDYSTIQ